MKRIFVIVVLSITVSSFVLGQAKDKMSKKAESQHQASQHSKAEEEILKLERAYLDARVKQDKAALNLLIADDYVANGSNGSGSTNKQEMIDRAGTTPSGQKIVSLDFDEARVRIYGDTAVLTGRRQIKTEQGQGQLRFMHIFVKRQSRWQMVASQVTSIPQQEAK